MITCTIFFAILICKFVKSDSLTNCNKEGEIVHAISTVFKCKNSHLVPVGCQISNSLSVDLGETAPKGNTILECRKKGENSTQLVPIYCYVDGVNLKPNEEYSNKDFYYRCKSTADENLSLESAGCVNANGEKIPFNGVVKRGTNFLYKCVGNSTRAALEPYKCTLNGKEYSIGDVVTEKDAFWSTCERGQGPQMSIKLKGCLDSKGQRLKVGDRWNNDNFVYKCSESENGGLAVNTVACLEILKPDNRTVEHQVGDLWLEQTNNNRFPSSVIVKYQLECYKDGENVGKRGVKCYFEIKNGQGIFLEPGCMKKTGKRLFTCPSTESTLLARYKEVANNQDVNEAKNNGLNFC